MRRKAEPNKLKWKILILAGAALLLTGSIFLRQYERKKAREDYEKYVKQESGTEGQEGKPEEGGTKNRKRKQIIRMKEIPADKRRQKRRKMP